MILTLLTGRNMDRGVLAQLYRAAVADEAFAKNARQLLDPTVSLRSDAIALEKTLVGACYAGYLLQKGWPHLAVLLKRPEFHKGQRVRYIPYHADDNELHGACEDGVVKRVSDDGGAVFVLYDNLHGRMTTGDEPFTAKNTPIECLIPLPPALERPGKKDYVPGAENK